MRRRALLPAVLALPGGGGAARAAIAAGSGRIEVHDAPGPVPVWVHRPAAWTPQRRVLVVMHGLRRDAERYRDDWRGIAERHAALLLVPEFSQVLFPGARGYNRGNLQDAEGRPTPPERWTFHVFERVVAAAMRQAGAARDGYGLYGHSAGAQFVQRHLLVTSAARAEAAVIANAGSYTLPRFDRPFPEGLGGIGAEPAAVRAAFARPVVLLLGEADTDPAHPSLPRQPWAAGQGSHRFARGWHAFDAARRAAADMGVPFAWRVVTVPGVGHSNREMAEHAAPLLLG